MAFYIMGFKVHSTIHNVSPHGEGKHEHPLHVLEQTEKSSLLFSLGILKWSIGVL